MAYGVLAQLAAEGRGDAELLDMMTFLSEIGLPTRLADMGEVPDLPDALEKIAALSMQSPHIAHLGEPVDQTGLLLALYRVEKLADQARL